MPDEAASEPPSGIAATPYRWPDPASLPRRQWAFGDWLLLGEVTAIVAAGGSGKSTLCVAMAISLASGRPFLGQVPPRGPLAVWYTNLEDGMEEIERQVAAATLFHGISQQQCGDRLYLDSGLDQPLCMATEQGHGFALNEEAFEQVAATIRALSIEVLIIDPFVSSHAVKEVSNEAIDAITKRWKRLAHETGCAVVLVHHTKKLGGREVTAEDGRGAIALRDAARIVLTLNRVSEKIAAGLGIPNSDDGRQLIRIDTGKANRTPFGKANWIAIEGQGLANGINGEPADVVGVATHFVPPDQMEDISEADLVAIRHAVAQGNYRDSVQAKEWVGHPIATVLGMSVEADMPRIKAIQRRLLARGALAREDRHFNGRSVPFIVAAKQASAAAPTPKPHPEKFGAEGAEGAAMTPLRAL